MNITLRLITVTAANLSLDANGVAPFVLGDEQTLGQLMAGLELSGAGTYLTLVNDSSIPRADWHSHVLGEGDTVTIFPPIKGG